jgi:hypothetical protein
MPEPQVGCHAGSRGLAKRRGMKVWFHSCGTFRAVLPDLIDIGMDVWETVQAHLPGNDPVELKREGRLHLQQRPHHPARRPVRERRCDGGGGQEDAGVSQGAPLRLPPPGGVRVSLKYFSLR